MTSSRRSLHLLEDIRDLLLVVANFEHELSLRVHTITNAPFETGLPLGGYAGILRKINNIRTIGSTGSESALHDCKAMIIPTSAHDCGAQYHNENPPACWRQHPDRAQQITNQPTPAEEGTWEKKTMASNPKLPKPGDLIFDASDLASYLIDLPEGAMRGLRAEQEGFKEVLAEIFANQADWGEKAGITAVDTADIEDLNVKIDRLDDFIPAGRKFVEMLLETRAKLDDRRQRLINTFAESIQRRAKTLSDGDSLLARYQRTRAYRSAPGKKAVRTRRRREQALQAQAEAGSSESTTS